MRLLWILLGAATLLAGTFLASRPTVEERTAALLDEQLTLWDEPARRAASIAELRAMNPEWDLMRRTFLALTLLDDALAHPERADAHLRRVDALLQTLLDEEAEQGHTWFLLPYALRRPFQDPDGRSLFVDGEVALIAAARRVVRDDPHIAMIHRARTAILERAFARSPVGLPESYPDEVWLFCVTNALASLRMADHLDGTDHRALFQAFGRDARERFTEPRSGLLGSSFTWGGQMLDGPEGSTIWLVATNLQLIDPELARAQYQGARRDLIHGFGGLAWASEWGQGWKGPEDIDSGPIVPGLDASPGSSGWAILAARAFDDQPLYAALTRSLSAADAVVVLDPRLATLADNPMGDVVVLHALTFGPLWARVGPPPT